MAVTLPDPLPPGTPPASDDALERATRPLLELVQHLSGLETSFLTAIDWEGQTQEVLVARNTGAIEIAEGAVVDWTDSMCRLVFLSGSPWSTDVPADFPGSIGADGVGMQTFFAVPVLDGDVTVGTVCGASDRSVELSDTVLGQIELIAEALTHQLVLQRESRRNLERAEKAEALAHTDELTGLANRREFTTKLEIELARSGRHGSPLSLLVLDLDDFKAINDRHGHGAGDALLRELADVLRRECRAEDVAARLGGDEFVMLLPGCDGTQAAAVGERIRGQFSVGSARLGLDCSVSVGCSSTDDTDRRSLLPSADAAMYDAKGRPNPRT